MGSFFAQVCRTEDPLSSDKHWARAPCGEMEQLRFVAMVSKMVRLQGWILGGSENEAF